MTEENFKENGYEIVGRFTVAEEIKKGTKAIIVKKDNKFFVMNDEFKGKK